MPPLHQTLIYRIKKSSAAMTNTGAPAISTNEKGSPSSSTPTKIIPLLD
jgi:hypothetical protein